LVTLTRRPQCNQAILPVKRDFRRFCRSTRRGRHRRLSHRRQWRGLASRGMQPHLAHHMGNVRVPKGRDHPVDRTVSGHLSPRGFFRGSSLAGHNAGKTAGILPGGLRADALLYLRASTNVDRVRDVGAVCHRLTGTRELERSGARITGATEPVSRKTSVWMAQVV
jgi:hypothetical protein